jgi:hypothetical protein
MIGCLRSSRTLCSSVETAGRTGVLFSASCVCARKGLAVCRCSSDSCRTKRTSPCVVRVSSLFCCNYSASNIPTYFAIFSLPDAVFLSFADADAVRRQHSVPEGPQGCLQRPGQPGRGQIQDGRPDRLVLRPVRVLACCWCACGLWCVLCGLGMLWCY